MPLMVVIHLINWWVLQMGVSVIPHLQTNVFTKKIPVINVYVVNIARFLHSFGLFWVQMIIALLFVFSIMNNW
jgi:hypothetical protein